MKPGWKKGTKITFQEKGDETPGVIAADIVFVIEEKKHPQFERDGNDLIKTKVVDLHEALLGTKVFITTLDGKSVNVDVPEIVDPKHVKVLVGEGMPLSKSPQQGGHEDQIRHTVSQGTLRGAEGHPEERAGECQVLIASTGRAKRASRARSYAVIYRICRRHKTRDSRYHLSPRAGFRLDPKIHGTKNPLSRTTRASSSSIHPHYSYRERQSSFFSRDKRPVDAHFLPPTVSSGRMPRPLPLRIAASLVFLSPRFLDSS